MSEWSIFTYEVRRLSRAEQRVRDRTLQYLQRNEDWIREMHANGLAQYVWWDVQAIEWELARIAQLLDTDPFEARDLNKALTGRIVQVRAYAKRLRAEERRQERERARRATRRQSAAHSAELQQEPRWPASRRRRERPGAKRRARGTRPAPPGQAQPSTEWIDQAVQDALAEMNDLVERDFAYDDLMDLADSLRSRAGRGESEQTLRRELETQLRTIRHRAQQAAAAWHRENDQEIVAEIATELAEVRAQELQDAEARAEAVARATRQLEQLRQLATAPGASLEKLRELDATVTMELDQQEKETLSEERRRTVVRAVWETLGRLGFVVEQPVRLVEGDQDVVIVRARRPRGEQAEVKVTATGALEYCFDQYEGRACVKDIDSFMQLLDQVYGIALSDKRVLWQNPDRIQKGARPRDLGHVDKQQH